MKGEVGTVEANVEKWIAGAAVMPVVNDEIGVKAGEGDDLKVVAAGTVGTADACADGNMGVVVDLRTGDGVDDDWTVAPMLAIGSDGSTLTCTSLPTSPA